MASPGAEMGLFAKPLVGFCFGSYRQSVLERLIDAKLAGKIRYHRSGCGLVEFAGISDSLINA